MMNNVARVALKMAGEMMEFLFDPDKREVYNPLFPGVTVHKVTLRCGHVFTHDEIVEVIENKFSKEELKKAFKQYKEDYSDLF